MLNYKLNTKCYKSCFGIAKKKQLMIEHVLRLKILDINRLYKTP